MLMKHALTRGLGLLVVSLLAALIGPSVSLATPPPDSQLNTDGSNVLGKTWRKQKTPQHHRRQPGPPSASEGSGAAPKAGTRRRDRGNLDQQIARARAAERRYRSALRQFDRDITSYTRCLSNGTGGACSRPSAPKAPPEATFAVFIGGPRQNQAPGAPVLTITPQQAAYMAVARLRLTPPTPNIGPPPKINRWKMAAVGYPLWLWADGTLNPGPVSDSVGGLNVSLDAHIDKVVFLMGDGTSVTCRGTGTKWTRSVTPGAESPTCGHRYTRPSLPTRKYTVTAQTHWAVDWNINGVTGTIPLVQQASTQLPVGELQVLVR